ncbi:hypothetical protein [Bradyrhizobium sp. CCGE-LA001]|nr:hypothetical protein [Bradyrhizobium sp. CCGE-LA001]
MELEHHNDDRDAEPQQLEQSEPAERTAFTPPFVSEGLERLRDSYC